MTSSFKGSILFLILPFFLLFSLTLSASDDLRQAPAAFEDAGRSFVFVDVQQVNYKIIYNIK